MGWQLASRRWDVALAVVVIAACEIQAATGTGDAKLGGPAWLGVASGVVLGVPLIWRRAHPALTLFVLFSAVMVIYRLGLSQPTQGYLGEIVAGVASMYSVAAKCPTILTVAGFGYGYVAVIVGSPDEDLSNRLGSILVLGAPVVIGRVLLARRTVIERLRETTEELTRSRENNAHAAVVAERVAIARELHDVVAHAVSVMVIQAGAAEQVLDSDPRQAREPIRAVQESGRDALVELRRLLGVLRPDPPSTSILSPQPGLAELGRLVENVQGAGMTVKLTVEGQPHQMSSGVDLAAFRILQEALTNALKHSQATTAQVTLRYEPDRLDLEVRDDGRGGSSKGAGGGHGLAGMRERAVLYGGELCAGPGVDGGFVVQARLPTADPR